MTKSVRFNCLVYNDKNLNQKFYPPMSDIP